jgi:thiol-disulfide isomerase/thioredoxin
MALTESKMLPLGSPAPDFCLQNVIDEKTICRTDFTNRPMLVMFICNHCPYVKHVQPELVRLANDYSSSPLAIVAIQSNDVESYPADSPELMKQEAQAWKYSFPYLYDPTQQIAVQFSAACTPDFFLFDSKHQLVYRGRLDETRPHRISSGVYNSDETPPHGRDLRAAVDAVLACRSPAAEQFPSMGCNIKWKPVGGPSTFRIDKNDQPNSASS